MNIIKIFFIYTFLLLSSLSYASNIDTISVDLQKNKTRSLDGQLNILVKNNGTKAIEVLKWNTIFEDTISANIFDIRMGKNKVQYLGREIKRAEPTANDYLTLQAGEERYINVDISKYYKMNKKDSYSINYNGTFKFSFKKIALFKTDKFKKELKKLKIKTKPMDIFFEPSIAPKTTTTAQAKETPSFNMCSSSNITALNNAHDEAIRIAEIAMNDMTNTNAPSSAPRYSEWFGSSDLTRHNKVRENFTNIYNGFENQNISFNCDCDENYYAFVYPSQPYEIYLCDAYWSAPATGTDSQAGTLIHEMSHFTIVADTDDHVYGAYNAKNLAISDPDSAVDNADNHEYFAENTPYLSMGTGSSYSITGTVTNAFTGNPISSALITLYGSSNQQTTSSSDGSYQFYNLNSGTYLASVDSFGYTQELKSTNIYLNSQILNFNLVPTTTSSNYNIILSWGQQPADLDARLWPASTSANECDQLINFENMGSTISEPFVSLNQDIYNSYGPETVTISKLPISGSHEYWVRNSSQSPSITSSNATVKIYKGSNLLETFTISPSPETSSIFWHVFDINEDGVISTMNSIQSEENPTCRKTDSSSSNTAHLPAIYHLLLQ